MLLEGGVSGGLAETPNLPILPEGPRERPQRVCPVLGARRAARRHGVGHAPHVSGPCTQTLQPSWRRSAGRSPGQSGPGGTSPTAQAVSGDAQARSLQGRKCRHGVSRGPAVPCWSPVGGGKRDASGGRSRADRSETRRFTGALRSERRHRAAGEGSIVSVRGRGQRASRLRLFAHVFVYLLWKGGPDPTC